VRPDVGVVSDEAFTVSDKKTATQVPIPFVDVERVNIKGMPDVAKVAIIVGAVFLVGVIVALATVKD
jgi:hypothetical protein